MSRPRLHDDGYLAFLRQQPCCVCGRVGETEAAHIRIGFGAMGKKPDDRYATPLCRDHHRWQHMQGEEEFWWSKGKNPFDVAASLYAQYGGTGGQPRRRSTAVKPRLPKHKRAKIASRPFPKRSKA